MKITALLLAAAAFASAACPTWVGRPEVYPVGSVLAYNGANYEVIRDLGNGWINPSDAWFWTQTTKTCDATGSSSSIGISSSSGTGGVVTGDLSQVLANQATILSLLQELKDGQAQIRADVTALGVKGQFADARDGQVYRIVKIGNQVWMAQNLNYQTVQSWCYNDDLAQCAIYGRLYDWNAAITACPEGWHLPTSAEWNTLKAAAGNKVAGVKLKATSGWVNNGNGSDDFGFGGLPGGFRSYVGNDFGWQGNYGQWWSATEKDANNALVPTLHESTLGLNEWFGQKNDLGFSVRCLQD